MDFDKFYLLTYWNYMCENVKGVEHFLSRTPSRHKFIGPEKKVFI